MAGVAERARVRVVCARRRDVVRRLVGARAGVRSCLSGRRWARRILCAIQAAIASSYRPQKPSSLCTVRRVSSTNGWTMMCNNMMQETAGIMQRNSKNWFQKKGRAYIGPC